MNDAFRFCADASPVSSSEPYIPSPDEQRQVEVHTTMTTEAITAMVRAYMARDIDNKGGDVVILGQQKSEGIEQETPPEITEAGE